MMMKKIFLMMTKNLMPLPLLLLVQFLPPLLLIPINNTKRRRQPLVLQVVCINVVDGKCKQSQLLLKLGTFLIMMTTFGRTMAILFTKRLASRVSTTSVPIVQR
jgi:hypothetical protein